MFSVAKANIMEGEVLENPIRLDGIEVDDFRQLLRVMYCTGPPLPPMILTTPQWIAVLNLATMWQFDKYRVHAITRLSAPSAGLTSGERVQLSLKYRIKSWLVPALNELAQRAEPMGLDDCKTLGLEYLLKICRVRERYTHVHCHKCPTATSDQPRRHTHSLKVHRRHRGSVRRGNCWIVS
ncbi:hypothetical protein BC835DRAFT_397625 [Cytidiella melzeri]|nr:hypothetical protein BC835DRAFT_397625 [Cytidiella melzeri]